MTVRTAWLVNDSMSGEDIRLSQTASQIHDTAIRSRSGVVPAPSNPLAVTIGSGMTVNVAAGQLVIGGQRAGAQGTYVITNDATQALTIANGDAAQPRTDAIVGYVRDTTYGDTTLVGGITVITGVAGVSFPIPTYTGTTALGTAVLLGTIKVLANTTSGGGGLSGMGAILTDQRVYAVAAGGLMPVAGTTEMNALTAYKSLTVFRLDLNYPMFYDGTIWRPPAGTRITRVTPSTIAASITTGQTGATNVGNIPTYTFPVEVEIRWGMTATQGTATDQWDALLWVNGSLPSLTGAAKRGYGGWDSVADTVKWDRAANDAAATFQLIFSRVGGASSAATLATTQYTYADAIVRAL